MYFCLASFKPDKVNERWQMNNSRIFKIRKQQKNIFKKSNKYA